MKYRVSCVTVNAYFLLTLRCLDKNLGFTNLPMAFDGTYYIADCAQLAETQPDPERPDNGNARHNCDDCSVYPVGQIEGLIVPLVYPV